MLHKNPDVTNKDPSATAVALRANAVRGSVASGRDEGAITAERKNAMASAPRKQAG